MKPIYRLRFASEAQYTAAMATCSLTDDPRVLPILVRARRGVARGVLQCGILGGAGANKGVTARITTAEAFEWNVSDGSGNRVTITSSAVSLNEPHHFVCVYDADEEKSLLYIDGALAGEAACSGFTVATNSTMQFGSASAQRYVGVADEFSIHAEALSAESVAARAALALA